MSFEGRFRHLFDAIQDQYTDAIAEARLEGHAAAIEHTPVDYGDTKKHWQHTRNGVPTDDVGDLEPGDSAALENPLVHSTVIDSGAYSNPGQSHYNPRTRRHEIRTLPSGHSIQAPDGITTHVRDRSLVAFKSAFERGPDVRS